MPVPTVFQRQSHKQNLSSVIVDAKEDIERHYSGDNLRQLFNYKEALCEARPSPTLSLVRRWTLTRVSVSPRRHTTCSSASAARTASRSRARPPCSTATRRRASPCLASPPDVHEERLTIESAPRWNHLTNECLRNIHDSLLRNETGLDAVTACFQCASASAPV